eukprot:1897737-Rhodomonas_salina.1
MKRREKKKNSGRYNRQETCVREPRGSGRGGLAPAAPAASPPPCMSRHRNHDRGSAARNRGNTHIPHTRTHSTHSTRTAHAQHTHSTHTAHTQTWSAEASDSPRLFAPSSCPATTTTLHTRPQPQYTTLHTRPPASVPHTAHTLSTAHTAPAASVRREGIGHSGGRYTLFERAHAPPRQTLLAQPLLPPPPLRRKPALLGQPPPRHRCVSALGQRLRPPHRPLQLPLQQRLVARHVPCL